MNHQSIPLPVSIPIHYDGLGTWLEIAETAILHWMHQGSLTEEHISKLQIQISVTAHNMGAAIELLGMERLDEVNDSPAMASALMLAGRTMQQLASMADTLHMAQYRLNHPPKKADSMDDVFREGA